MEKQHLKNIKLINIIFIFIDVFTNLFIFLKSSIYQLQLEFFILTFLINQIAVINFMEEFSKSHIIKFNSEIESSIININ